MGWAKFKPFAGDKLNAAKMMIFPLDGVENIVGKGENAVNQHFLLFPQCFQKASSIRSLKVGIVWCRVKNYGLPHIEKSLVAAQMRNTVNHFPTFFQSCFDFGV